jgi:hypothetical protein
MSLLAPAHQKASAFVKAFQDPFGQFLTQLTTPIFSAWNSKTLTYDQAKAALDSFNQQWQGFDLAAQAFGSQGGDYAKVVKQAYDPSKAFMQTVNSVRDTLKAYVDNLTPATTDTNNTADATTPPDPNKPPGTGGQSAQDTARSAAVAQSKRNAAGVGFLSTILGGEQPGAMTKRKTLLGY